MRLKINQKNMKYNLLNVLQDDNAKKPLAAMPVDKPMTHREKEQSDHFSGVVKKANESISRNKSSRNIPMPGNLKISKSFKELVSRA